MKRELVTGMVVALKAAPAHLGDDGLSRVQFLEPGEHKGKAQSGPFHVIVDRAGAEEAIAAFRRDLSPMKPQVGQCDYDHKALFGEDTRSAGRIKDFEWDDERGLMALVRWTPTAAQAIRDEEYMYLSPVFATDPATHKLTRVYQLALTNDPAFTNLRAVAANGAAALDTLLALAEERDLVAGGNGPNGPAKESTMLIDELRRLAGLPPEADKFAVCSKICELADAQDLPTKAAKADAMAAALALVAGKAGLDPKALEAGKEGELIAAKLGETLALIAGKDGELKKLADELTAAKAEAGKLHEELTAAKTARDAAQTEVAALKLDARLTEQLAHGRTTPAEIAMCKAFKSAEDQESLIAAMAARKDNSIIPLATQGGAEASAALAGGGSGRAAQILAAVTAKATALRAADAHLGEGEAVSQAWTALRKEQPGLFAESA